MANMDCLSTYSSCLQNRSDVISVFTLFTTAITNNKNNNSSSKNKNTWIEHIGFHAHNSESNNRCTVCSVLKRKTGTDNRQWGRKTGTDNRQCTGKKDWY